MHKLTVFIPFLLLCFAEDAFARPDVRTMTCAQARALVLQNGAVVLTTGQYTYDRYVARQAYCFAPFVIQRAWVATADTEQCPVGYTCEQRVIRPLFGRDD